jgi:hypothetical protein
MPSGDLIPPKQDGCTLKQSTGDQQPYLSASTSFLEATLRPGDFEAALCPSEAKTSTDELPVEQQEGEQNHVSVPQADPSHVLPVATGLPAPFMCCPQPMSVPSGSVEGKQQHPQQQQQVFDPLVSVEGQQGPFPVVSEVVGHRGSPENRQETPMPDPPAVHEVLKPGTSACLHPVPMFSGGIAESSARDHSCTMPQTEAQQAATGNRSSQLHAHRQHGAAIPDASCNSVEQIPFAATDNAWEGIGAPWSTFARSFTPEWSDSTSWGVRQSVWEGRQTPSDLSNGSSGAQVRPDGAYQESGALHRVAGPILDWVCEFHCPMLTLHTRYFLDACSCACMR